MYRKRTRAKLHRNVLNTLRGIDGAAVAMGVPPSRIRMWLRRGLSAEGEVQLFAALCQARIAASWLRKETHQ